jgi:hypothetical protein
MSLRYLGGYIPKRVIPRENTVLKLNLLNNKFVATEVFSLIINRRIHHG